MIISNFNKSITLFFLNLVVLFIFCLSISACAGNEDGNYNSGSTLINCKTCDGKVSKNARGCPHCGEPNPRPVTIQDLAKAKAAIIAETVYLYVLDMGLSAPSDDFDLEVLLLSSDDGGGPSGPYLQRAEDLLDPWGNPFEIILPPGTIHASFDIISLGEDGEPGGEGANKDITQ